MNQWRVAYRTPLGRVMLFLSVLTLSSACAESDPDAESPVISEVKDASGASLGSVAIPVSCTPEAATRLRNDWGIKVQVQEVTVQAWIAFAEGRVTKAVTLMNEAHELESTTEKNPVTPNEVLPAAELLGDMLLALDRYDEALPAYESALKRSPNRVNSLFGAGRAAELAGDADAARGYYRQLVTGTVPDSKHEQLSHARSVLAGD